MEFICPECEHSPFTTLKGWKRHLTAVHNGYTPEQVEAVTHSESEGTAVTGESALESAIAGLPDTEDEAESRQMAAADRPPELTKEQRAAAKRIRAKFDSLKQRISADIPEQVFRFGGIELTEQEKGLLSDSIQTSFEVFGIDFEVQPFSFTVRNPFIVLLYPLLVIGFITVTKIFQAKQNEEKPE